MGKQLSLMKSAYLNCGKESRLFCEGTPEVLLVEPIDRNDLDFIDREVDYLQAQASRSFALATFLIEDWNNELTPWKADAVFGKEPFGDGALGTLAFIKERLIPSARLDVPVILGGYSLAALFALWAGYADDSFAGIAAASPSVWYPGWMDFARSHRPKAERIYLSLGDAEEKTRNRVMATVGDCIRQQAALLEAQGVPHTLQWNPGNHFKDADLRTARAFLWTLDCCPTGNNC